MSALYRGLIVLSAMEGGRTGRGRGGALARGRRLEDRFALRENSLNTVIEQGQPSITDRFAHGSGSQSCAAASGLCATALPLANSACVLLGSLW